MEVKIVKENKEVTAYLSGRLDTPAAQDIAPVYHFPSGTLRKPVFVNFSLEVSTPATAARTVTSIARVIFPDGEKVICPVPFIYPLIYHQFTASVYHLS